MRHGAVPSTGCMWSHRFFSTTKCQLSGCRASPPSSIATGHGRFSEECKQAAIGGSPPRYLAQRSATVWLLGATLMAAGCVPVSVSEPVGESDIPAGSLNRPSQWFHDRVGGCSAVLRDGRLLVGFLQFDEQSKAFRACNTDAVFRRCGQCQYLFVRLSEAIADEDDVISGGWAFARVMSFTEDECVLRLPDWEAAKSLIADRTIDGRVKVPSWSSKGPMCAVKLGEEQLEDPSGDVVARLFPEDRQITLRRCDSRTPNGGNREDD